MSSVWAFSQEMLTLYGIALLGFILRKKGTLNEHSVGVFTQLILYVTLPALILFSLDITFSFSLMKEFFWLIFLSIFILIASCLLAGWLRKRSSLPNSQKSVYEGLIIFGNQGFLGFAVSYILLGQQGIIYLTIFNVCYLILIWTYGIYLFTKGKDGVNWRNIFLNPGILSTLLGVIFFLTPLSWPSVIANGLESVGKMTVPLSMLLIGCLVGNVKIKEFGPTLVNRYLWFASITKLLIIPLLLVPFAIFSIPFPVLVIAVVVSGMPSASTISLYAQKYGGDSFFASVGVLLTTLLCIITIPLLYLICVLVGA